MTQKKIEIDKQGVWSDVVLESQYCSKRNLGRENFEMIAMSSADRKFLDRFWEVSVSNLCAALRMFVDARYEDDTTLRLTVAMPSGGKEDAEDDLADSIRNYLITNIALLWYEKVLPSEAQKMRDSAITFLEECRGLLNFRKKPSRRCNV